MTAASIQPLPPEAAARIRSSSAITTLNEAVAGLVKNSLDAGATRISVSVEYARGNCVVDDDGDGILPAEFREGGGLGRANCACIVHRTILCCLQHHGRQSPR
jgi:DNA mismatch repair protein MLH3